MGDLSPHFSSREFRCRDGSEHEIDCPLIAMLEAIRCHFGAPVNITSGYRSPSYNAAVGGAPNSYHLRGEAADFQVPSKSIIEVHRWCDDTFPICGLGLYARNGGWGWIHIDSREGRARWSG